MQRTRDSTLAVRGDRQQVRDILRATGTAAALAPERDGWQSVRLPASLDTGPLAARLAAELDTVVLGAELDHDRTALTLAAWRPGSEPVRLGGRGGTAGDRAAGDVAAAFGRAELADDLARTVLDPPRPATDRARAAEGVLGLPAGTLADREPRSVALYGPVSPEAETTAATLGGACLADLGRWSLWVPADPERATLGLAAGLSRARGRRDRALWLWQDGDHGGYLVLVGGRPVDTHAWSPGWEFLAGREPGDDVPRTPTGDAAVLAGWCDRPEVEVALRALLRRRQPAGTVLPELAALLDLPDALPAVLAGRAEVAALPGARWRERASVWQVSVEEARRTAENRPPAVQRTWLVLAGLAAVIGAVLTVVELAALAGVDAAGQGETLSLLRFAGFTGLMTWLAVRRCRRLRR